MSIFDLFRRPRTNSITYRLSPRHDQRGPNVVSNLEDLDRLIRLNRSGGVTVTWDANPTVTGTGEIIIDRTIDWTSVKWQVGQHGYATDIIFANEATAPGLRDFKHGLKNGINIVNRNLTASPINTGIAYDANGDADASIPDGYADVIDATGEAGRWFISDPGAPPLIHHHGQRVALIATGSSTGLGNLDLAPGEPAVAPVLRVDAGAPFVWLCTGGGICVKDSVIGPGNVFVQRIAQPKIASQRFTNQHSGHLGFFGLNPEENGVSVKVGRISAPTNSHDGSQFILVDAQDNDVALELPNVALWQGMAIQFIDDQPANSTNSFRLTYGGDDVITLDIDSMVLTVQSDGANWRVTQKDVV